MWLQSLVGVAYGWSIISDTKACIILTTEAKSIR